MYLGNKSHLFSPSIIIFSTVSGQDFRQPFLIRDLRHSGTGGKNKLHLSVSWGEALKKEVELFIIKVVMALRPKLVVPSSHLTWGRAAARSYKLQRAFSWCPFLWDLAGRRGQKFLGNQCPQGPSNEGNPKPIWQQAAADNYQRINLNVYKYANENILTKYNKRIT